MNVMIDPLMALNLTPVHGGLVILLGDDPGGYGSQNDQDTRPLAPMLEMPWLEPATPAEGFAMIRAAFDALRATPHGRRRAHHPELRPAGRGRRDPRRALSAARPGPGPRDLAVRARPPQRRREAPRPARAAGPHGSWADDAALQPDRRRGRPRHHRGRVRPSQAARRARRRAPGRRPRPRAGRPFPLPRDVLARFLAGCREVLLLEENEPYLEVQVKALAHDLGSACGSSARQTGHTRREGELYRWQIQQALERFLPGFAPGRAYLEVDEASERPPRENYLRRLPVRGDHRCAEGGRRPARAGPVARR